MPAMRLAVSQQNPRITTHGTAWNIYCWSPRLKLSLQLLYQVPHLSIQLGQLLPGGNGLTGVKATLNRPTTASSTMHPAAAVCHLVVFAGRAGCTTLRATKGLHGVSHGFPPAPPGWP